MFEFSISEKVDLLLICVIISYLSFKKKDILIMIDLQLAPFFIWKRDIQSRSKQVKVQGQEFSDFVSVGG